MRGDLISSSWAAPRSGPEEEYPVSMGVNFRLNVAAS
ncbi:MAG: Uncharacterised protein [uncultured Bacteroidota bacterium]|nr:MAG: Uncharacterised protein [uncultured Bacteroidetes bacterium]